MIVWAGQPLRATLCQPECDSVPSATDCVGRAAAAWLAAARQSCVEVIPKMCNMRYNPTAVVDANSH
jgi:hypothetical protein